MFLCMATHAQCATSTTVAAIRTRRGRRHLEEVVVFGVVVHDPVSAPHVSLETVAH